ncbi:MAG: DUF4625 domain-containing protein [Bacteroidales bacterium]
MKRAVLLLLVPLLMIGYACDKQDETDTQKPVIDMDFAEAFPRACDTVVAGEQFVFRARFSDNRELGSFNLELHQNFDHHSHGSHVETCPMDPVKEPVNPFYLNESYNIPEGQQTYEAQITMDIPEGVDEGDYHFMVKLTDREGWQSWKSVSLKLIANGGE